MRAVCSREPSFGPKNMNKLFHALHLLFVGSFVLAVVVLFFAYTLPGFVIGFFSRRRIASGWIYGTGILIAIVLWCLTGSWHFRLGEPNDELLSVTLHSVINGLFGALFAYAGFSLGCQVRAARNQEAQQGAAANPAIR